MKLLGYVIDGGDVDPVYGHQLLVATHQPEDCAGHSCVVHRPSGHRMRGWRLHWRADRGLFERICEHGCGHPDPDQVAYWRRTLAPEDADAQAVHGCDRCCQGPS